MKRDAGTAKIKGGNAKSMLITIVSVLGIALLLLTLFYINNSKAKMVQIVCAKQDIWSNQLITTEILESYGMSNIEYLASKNKYLLWEEREEANNNYATVNTKAGSYIFKGDYKPTKPIKNEWLQKVEDGQLVVSMPYAKGDAFGNILTPGDTVKVNIAFTEDMGVDPLTGLTTSGVKAKVETLFEGIKVIDLLNASGNSIYDYYMDLLAMPIADRETYLRDEKFLSNVSPVRILLSVGKGDEFDNYTKVQNYTSLKYTYGLYPRKEGDTVLDQFQDLTRQITAAQTAAQAAESGVGTVAGGK